MRRFLRAERLLDVLVVLLAVPTLVATASLARDIAPGTTPTLRQAAADASCGTTAPSACFANPERRERAMARTRVHDVQRAWQAAGTRLVDSVAVSPRREPRWKLAVERCDGGGADCTLAFKAE